MGILITVLYIIACVLLFALAILVHEFGHFIVARKLGLEVEAFSIGFGPVLWKKKVNGVEYRLSAIPLGGYVSIPDVDPEGTKALEGEKVKGEGVKGERVKIPAWKELAVAVAGPAMNVVLAVVLAVILSLVPGAKFGQLEPVIGEVVLGGPAAEAELQSADRVLAVGGREVKTWTEMQTEVQISGGKPIDFLIRRGEEERVVQVTPRKDERSGAYFILALSQKADVVAKPWMPDRNPLKQLAWDAGSIIRVLKGLVTPKEAKATAGALGGPVMIAEGIYRSMRTDPWDGIGFLRFLNVNLAVLNLLPIPVLDGGLILFALIALITRRRVPQCIVKYTSLFFMVLLMGLMVLLIVKDSRRSYRLHTAPTSAPAKVEAVTEAPPQIEVPETIEEAKR